MVELKPEEIASNRLSYIRSLAIALIRGRTLGHWNSATAEEREEARNLLVRAGFELPDERILEFREAKRLAAARRAYAAELAKNNPKTDAKAKDSPAK